MQGKNAKKYAEELKETKEQATITRTKFVVVQGRMGKLVQERTENKSTIRNLQDQLVRGTTMLKPPLVRAAVMTQHLRTADSGSHVACRSPVSSRFRRPRHGSPSEERSSLRPRVAGH